MNREITRRDFLKSVGLGAGSLLIGCPRQDVPIEKSSHFVDVGGESTKVDLFCPVSGENNPLLLFSHGFGGSPILYEDLLESFAENGYPVLAPYHKDYAQLLSGEGIEGLISGVQSYDLDMESVLKQIHFFLNPDNIHLLDMVDFISEDLLSEEDLVLEVTNLFRDYFSYRVDDLSATYDLGVSLAEGDYNGRVDVERVGVFCHSLGGFPSIEKILEEDSRIKAGLFLSPLSKLSDVPSIGIPNMWMTGTLDEPGIRETARQVFDNLEGESYFIDFKDFGHVTFCRAVARLVNLSQEFGFLGFSDFFTPEEVNACMDYAKKFEAIKDTSLAFLNLYLKGEGSADLFLSQYQEMVNEYVVR